MAIGFTPSYMEDLYLEAFTPHQFLIMALDTAREINWRIDFTSESGFIAFTNKGRFKWNAKITFKIDGGKATIKSESVGNEMIDLGRNKKTVAAFTTVFIDKRYGSNPMDLTQQYAELQTSLAPAEQDVLAKPEATPKEKFSEFFSLFVPREGYFITPILIDINIFVFIAMAASGINIMTPDTDSLLRWGANFRPLTLEGQWWRLITNCFIHIGIAHLLFNMYALLYIGLLLEPRLGRNKFTAAYFLTGIIASLSSLWWHDLTVSAGASGAIFGMYGVFLAMLTTKLIEKNARKAMLLSISIFVAYNLLYGMKSGVDNAAHVGGLVSGLIIGYAFYPSLKKSENSSLEYSTIGILALLILSSSFIFMKTIPNDIPRYDEKMKLFSSNESQALELYSMAKGASKDQLLHEINDRGLYYWNENVKILHDMQKLKIPAHLKERDEVLLNYCDVRIKSYQLIYKGIDEDTGKYNDSIAIYNQQIDAMIKSLKGK